MPRRKIVRRTLQLVGELLTRFDHQSVAIRAATAADFDFSLRNTRLINSWGLMALCDLRCAKPETAPAAADYLTQLPQLVQKAGGRTPLSIYVESEPALLGRFATEIAPRLERPFVLLTGGTDHAVDASQSAAVNAITALPHMVAWYTQNLRIAHPRIAALPIGLDYHTMWKSPSMWQGRHLLPLHQESELIEVLQLADPFERREMSAYCNWHFHSERGDRKECLQQVDPGACHFEPQPVPRHVSWTNQSRFAFVLSPEGAGMDCHRTWEAIALGSVPVLRRNPLCELLRDLPAVVVDDWREVTPGFLRRQADILEHRRFDFSTLFLSAWRARLRGEIFRWPRMTLGEFQRFLATGSLE